jgi:hypothetical protein
MLDKYCRNVIRNSILSYLDSYPKGDWYIGRTRQVRDKKTGEVTKVYLPPRFSSLDQLTEEFGAQIDEGGNLTWTTDAEGGRGTRGFRSTHADINDTSSLEMLEEDDA